MKSLDMAYIETRDLIELCLMKSLTSFGCHSPLKSILTLYTGSNQNEKVILVFTFSTNEEDCLIGVGEFAPFVERGYPVLQFWDVQSNICILSGILVKAESAVCDFP